jgi:RHS repeat-associated protein
VVAETTATGALQALYVRAGDDLIAQLRPDATNPGALTTRYYHADAIGSIRALTDEAGAITDKYEYTAFGEKLTHEGDDKQPYAFTAEPRDPSAAWQHHRARWLDPTTGRFTRMDAWPGTSYDPASLHRYLYARTDPVDRIDPSGLSESSLTGRLTAIAAQVTIFLSNFGSNLRSAFAQGGPVLGEFFQNIGRYAQDKTLHVLQVFQRFHPQLIVRESKEAGPRVIDFFVRFGNRSAFIETKWGLPWRRGEALLRLAEQVKAAAMTGEGEVVIFTIRAPTAAQLDLLRSALGNLQVTLVHGVDAWGEWLTRFVGR